ncbi:MAG: trigger factor [Alphaproteobacteria bacterium]|nr:trigger factor [Alphaproteobacteria bacterium]
MQVTETSAEGLKRAFKVVFPAADIEARADAKLDELGKTLRLPGFRPGKVPKPLVKQRYGGQVLSEVLQDTVNDATRQVVSDRGLKPALQPKIEITRFDQGQEFEFTVAVEVLPEIKLPNLKEVKLERMTAEPEESAMQKALDDIAARNRTTVAVAEARAAEKGDVLKVDFVGRIDGKEFDGGKADGVEIDVAGDGFIPGFTEQLVGMKAGEKRTINVTFPAEYPAEAVAGKAAEFDITAHELKKSVLPALDDAFAKTLGFEGIGQMKDELKKRFQNEYDQLSRMRLKRQLLDELAKCCDFPVPEGMIDAEFGAIWERIEADMKAGRLDDDDKAKDEATLKAEYRAIAERRVRLGLLLSEIGQTNNIQVSRDDLNRAVVTEAQRYPGQERMVFEYFQKNPDAVEQFRPGIFEEKVVDFVLELASVSERKVVPADLLKDPDAEAAPAAG